MKNNKSEFVLPKLIHSNEFDPLSEKLVVFFKNLSNFSKYRHDYLSNPSQTEATKLAEKELALREKEKSDKMVVLAKELALHDREHAKLWEITNNEFNTVKKDAVEEIVLRQQEIALRSKQLFCILRKSLEESSECLRERVFMDSALVQVGDSNDKMRSVLKRSEYLHLKSQNLLNNRVAPNYYIKKLDGIETEVKEEDEEPASPWMRESDIKAIQMLKQYTVKRLDQKFGSISKDSGKDLIENLVNQSVHNNMTHG